MNPEQASVDAFLTAADMHPGAVGLESTVDYMLGEMDRGLSGGDSSLAMIPTYVETDRDIPAGERVVVLDAGGTNLRAALVSFPAEGKPLIEDFSRQPMPGTQGKDVGRDEFFDSLAALVEPLAGRGSRIGFCFSYPTEIFPDKDGRLLYWSKEVRAPEVEGTLIGTGLRDALRERGVASPPGVIILNDTVATLLTGKVSQGGREWGGYTGFILGTGTNTSYVESNAAVSKVSGLNRSHHQIINCESGNFRCPDRGRADIMLGNLTGDPNAYWLEKMLSGRYFGPLATQLLRLAGEKGLLSSGFHRRLTQLGDISTRDADNYLHNPSDRGNGLCAAVKDSGSAGDALRVWYLIDALLERAARLTASNLAASVLKGHTGDGPIRPVCMSIDGTTFFRYYRFRFRVEGYLRPYLASRDKYYEMVQVDDAPLIGAAVAALTN